MGHVEPEGAAEALVTADAKQLARRRKRLGVLADNPLWALWLELTELYPLWRSVLAGFSPNSPFRSESSYFWFDVIRGIRSMASSQQVIERLQAVSDSDLAALVALGEINSRRQEHFFRSLVLAYITVPLTVGAIWAQLYPGNLIALARNPELASVWGGTIAGLASAILIRFVADWRARAFLAVLQIAQIERSTSISRPATLPHAARNSSARRRSPRA